MNKIEFKIIKGNESSEEINEILNEEDMESSIQIRYIKYPTLFDSLKLDAVKDPLIVPGIDTTNNKIVGLGACTIFEDNIAYLNSFRIRKEYRNKVNFGNGYKKIIEELEKEGIDTIITTILDDNKMAKEILTKQRRNMPIYEFYKNITFYSIKNIKKNNMVVDDLYITEYKNFRIEIKNKPNKKYFVEDYKGIYKFLYKIRKMISFFGYPELPKKNSEMQFLYIDIIAKDNEYSNTLEAIKYLQNIGCSCDFFMIGTYENSSLDTQLKKIKSFKYKSKLYKVYYGEDKNKGKDIKFKFWNL